MDAQTAFWVAQGISIVTGILAIVLKQMKEMKKILILEVVANSLAMLNYIFVGGDSGWIVSGIAVINAVVMLVYFLCNKKAPSLLVVVFLGIYITSSAVTLAVKGDFMELLPACAAVCYSVSMMQKKPSFYRAWSVLNPVFWTVYDIYTTSYVMSIVHFGIFVSTLVAMIRLDGFLGIVKNTAKGTNSETETRE